jgi:hypothetical protein
MNLKVLKILNNSIRIFKNDELLWKYIIDKGYIRIDYFRNAIYSITTVLIITFILKIEFIDLINIICFCIGIFCFYRSASILTDISIFLKVSENNYNREINKNINKIINLNDWIYNETIERENNQEKKKLYEKKAFLIRKVLYYISFACFLLFGLTIYNDTSREKNVSRKDLNAKVNILDSIAQVNVMYNIKILNSVDSILTIEKNRKKTIDTQNEIIEK